MKRFARIMSLLVSASLNYGLLNAREMVQSSGN